MSPGSGARTWRFAAPVLALLFAALAAVNAVDLYPAQVGADFYHLWGIPLTQRIAAPINPYAQTERSATVLNAEVAGAGSARLEVANRFRRTIEPTGTPLFYAAFAWLPSDYDLAHAIFSLLQYAAFAGAVFWLARQRGVGSWSSASLAALAALVFDPFWQDLKVGNVNALQLVALTGLVALAGDGARLARDLVAGLCFSFLGLLTVFKPNVAWIAVALFVSLALAGGRARIMRAFAFAAGAAAVGIALGALYFRDAGVWGDWMRYTQGANGGTLLYSVAQGNFAPAMRLSEALPALGPVAWGLVVSAAVLLSILAAIAKGAGPAGVAPAIHRTFADAGFAASVGVVVTLAGMPLLWLHYLTFALLPIAWLCGRGVAATACAVAAFAILTTPVIVLGLVGLGAPRLVHGLVTLSWLPLAAGLCLVAARRRVNSQP